MEQRKELGTSLPISNSETTTHAGDIVLYNGNQIVIFYGSNSWSYTRLGHVDDLTGWEEALGSVSVALWNVNTRNPSFFAVNSTIRRLQEGSAGSMIGSGSEREVLKRWVM